MDVAMTPRTARSDRGFTLIDLLFVIAIMGTVMSLAIPGLMRARFAAGASSAIGSLRVINSAQLSYAITCGQGFYAPDLMTLGTPPAGSTAAFISPDLGSANVVVKSSWQIQMTGTPLPGAPVSCNGAAQGSDTAGYRAGADPLGAALARFFATNASGVIYEANVPIYAAMPETGTPVGLTPLQ
jgi:prepilin-type N-terminal cleavage/methylation domain-containing protein